MDFIQGIDHTVVGVSHVNQAYVKHPDDGTSEGSGPTIKAATADTTTARTDAKEDTTNASSDGTNGINGGGTGRNPTSESSARYIKRDSSTVDFTLPEKSRDREDHYRERSKSISDGPYRGMGKEELLRYSSRPLWRNLRYACMSIVLTGWLALLITVVALVLTYPDCRDAQAKDWWQKTVVYRIYVRSFLDTDGDGIGDLNGIREKLDYLQDTGVTTISLSPIYKLATDAETDTHIVNHTDIDAVFGTMDDFRKLVNDTHARGMHIMLDFIPNHTSDQHPWFLESKTTPNRDDNPYRSYYVWARHPGANGIGLPNNWISVYDCPAWSVSDPDPNYNYLHQFLHSQPDLNLRSEKVRVELEEILQFWLDMDVDGFYIRDSDFLFEDYDLRDDLQIGTTEKVCARNEGKKYPVYSDFQHEYTRGLSELFDMLARWRAFLDEQGNLTGSYKIMIADVDGTYDQVMKYYGLFNRDGVDFPLNKFSLGLNVAMNGSDVASMVTTWMRKMPSGRWANWMGGDDRSPRLADRLGEYMAMPYLILTMLLPGTPYLYYGDEIGMHHVQDVNVTDWSRNQPMRGPMQWDNAMTAGFCSQFCSTPWMNMHADYKDINVEAQGKNPYSILSLVRNLTELRSSSPSFEYGDYIPSIQDDEVFSFVREFDGEKGFLVALNFVNETVRKQLTGTHRTIPSGAKIDVISGLTSRRKGDNINLDPVTLEPYQGVVVSWEYKAKEL